MNHRNSYIAIIIAINYWIDNRQMTVEKGANVCADKIYNEIFRQHSKNLYNFLYYKFGPDNNPNDHVQEAFLKLWKKCKDVIPEKAKSFLFTVANNQVLNEIAKKKTALDYQKTPIKSTNLETPEYLIEEHEYMERLKEALNSLTEDQRVTFMLNRVEDKKHKEIAEMLGISRKTVEKRIYTALKVLREKLGDNIG
ncbi:MAG: RNA polymerase sigma-70 factor (ECF subfamily) [Cyclobacteriaceae bacterium]